MKILKYLIPQFLKKADAHLLQNYPIIWETKIHFILFYSTIVANLSLFNLAWLMPIDFKFVPDFKDWTEIAMGWSAFSVFLILCFYFYQQSFIRIKVYTFKETVLRYCMYILVLISFGTNILALPQGIISRVRQAYSKEEIKKDFFDLARMEYLTDLTGYILNHTSESESSKYFEILQKSPLNKNKEVSEILQGLKDYNEIIDKKHILGYKEKLQKFTNFSKDNLELLSKLVNNNNRTYNYDYDSKLIDSLFYLKEDHKRICDAIKNHPKWNKDFKKQLTSKIDIQSIFDLSQKEFDECDIELMTTTSQKILSKYASVRNGYKKYYTKTKYEEERYRYDYDSYDSYYKLKNGVGNLSAFYHADLFLQTKYDFYTNQLFKSINNHIIEPNNFDDRIINTKNHSNKDILLYLSEKEKDTYMASLMDEKFVNAKIEEFLWKEDIENSFSSSLLSLFITQLALVLLVAKFFTFRNLFISGFGIIASILSIALLLYFPLFRKLSLMIFDLNGYEKDSYFNSYSSMHVLYIDIASCFIFFISIFFILYSVRQKTNLKWLKTLFVFLLGSTLALQVFGFEYLLRFNENGIYGTNLFYLYETLVFVMFALYYLYNRMLALPLKK